VEFGDKFRVGGGFNQLVTRHHPSLDRVIYVPNGTDTMHIAKLKFYYMAYFIDYVFYSNGKWEFSIPMQFGIGSSKYQYKDLTGHTIQIDKKPIILYEPAVTGQFKITKWFGVGMGAGFRIMLLNNKAVDEKFNSFIYILKLKVFFEEIYRSVAPKLEPNI